jgi:hypothetical protein
MNALTKAGKNFKSTIDRSKGQLLTGKIPTAIFSELPVSLAK